MNKKLCIFGLVLAVAVGARAGQGDVALLYHQFLNNQSDSRGFVAFSRDLIFPPERSQSSETNSDDTSKQPKAAALRNARHWYYAYCWDGKDYVIGLSKNNVFSNLTDLVSADSLQGFDGQYYWSLSLNYSTRSYVGRSGDGPETPSSVHNSLTLIGKDEQFHESLREYLQEPMVRSMSERIGECRRVVQFGCSYPLSAPPGINDSTLILKLARGRQLFVEINGSPDHPKILNYSGTLPRGIPPAFSVSNNYEAGSITITRLSQDAKSKVNEVRYGIQAVAVPGAANLKSVFSWRTYLTNAEPLVAETVIDGETRRIDPATLQIGEVTSTASPIRKK